MISGTREKYSDTKLLLESTPLCCLIENVIELTVKNHRPKKKTSFFLQKAFTDQIINDCLQQHFKTIHFSYGAKAVAEASAKITFVIFFCFRVFKKGG